MNISPSVTTELSTMMNKRNQPLSTGTIAMQIAKGKWQDTDLFEFAERKNPKRAFLFVSKILGKHIPVSPRKMRSAYQDLAQQIPENIPEPILFIGMAETAVGLAGGIYEEARKKYPNSLLLTTTRHPIDSELLCEFKEEHSHATDHLIYIPDGENKISFCTKFRTLILIDDESTTGRTFHNLISSLFHAGLRGISQIFTVTLTDWSGDVLSHQHDMPITSLALMRGQWEWHPDPSAPLPTMPNVNVTEKGAAMLSSRQDWGRRGMAAYDGTGWLNRYSASPGERILVLGTGEFLYPPFLLAEQLEQQGAEVRFSSTTRSPIAEGLAIQSSLAFTDNYGLNIPNYCYNVAHQTFDRIIVCTETRDCDLDPAFLAALANVATTVEVAVYD
ncbi:adenine/guanine phosphoribosyltransferase [Photobacterium aphoticum]|uniref:Adenine/guanine phosphoribosyltransferase n=2 Tax=Photobacterium aphoticum TaxID=754436 RepID=A0A0J1JAE6_9GAMM|nr:adenine/guanine phosphoribosyltransferase [Photobacterium aphoticum]